MGARVGVPRKPRAEIEPGLHHVFARGNNRCDVFLDDVDRRVYLGLLVQVTRRRAWRCLAYCLMKNHVHLLLETVPPQLGAGMRDLHGRYAQHFNRRHRRIGHLFGGRFGAVRIEDDAQLWMTVAYIARNPVDAGYCRAADEWRWSSHGASTTQTADPCTDRPRLLEYFAAYGGPPEERYRECVTG